MSSLFSHRLGKFIESAEVIVNRHCGIRSNGEAASLRTQEFSRQVVRETCRRLHRLGFYLEDISGLSQKHIQAVVQDWHRQGLSNKTMQNQYSRLKSFCKWLGKPELIDHSGIGVAAYLPQIPEADLKVKTYTDESKSWTGRGVDVVEKLQAVMLNDARHGHMLRMGLAFGLRKKEQLRLKLWQADLGVALTIEGSVAKGGRPRIIPIDIATPYGQFQRHILDEAKKVCRKNQTLSWPTLNYKQAENRYYYYLRILGITKDDSDIVGHGLRAEFAENQAMIRGLLPPSLGGTNDQMPKAERREILEEVSALLGHNDLHTVGSYFSVFRKSSVKTDTLGGQVGPTVAVDVEKEIFMSLWVHPKPVPAADGTYRQQSPEEARRATVTAMVEIPWETEKRMPVTEFLAGHPELTEKLTAILERVGFRNLVAETQT